MAKEPIQLAFGGSQHFDGPAYDPPFDHSRLTGQLRRIVMQYVHWNMSGDEWHTLGEIAEATGDPEASISAQLRHLRKPRFGSHTVERRRRGEPHSGLWEYRIIFNTDKSDA